MVLQRYYFFLFMYGKPADEELDEELDEERTRMDNGKLKTENGKRFEDLRM